MVEAEPVDSGLVNEDMLRRLEEWFKSRAITLRCPICSSQHWQAIERLVTPMTWYPERVELGGVSYPTLVLVCVSCGSMQSFNAVLLGLLQPAVKEGKDPMNEASGLESG